MRPHTTHFDGCDCYKERIEAPLKKELSQWQELAGRMAETLKGFRLAWILLGGYELPKKLVEDILSDYSKLGG